MNHITSIIKCITFIYNVQLYTPHCYILFHQWLIFFGFQIKYVLLLLFWWFIHSEYYAKNVYTRFHIDENLVRASQFMSFRYVFFVILKRFLLDIFRINLGFYVKNKTLMYLYLCLPLCLLYVYLLYVTYLWSRISVLFNQFPSV